MDKVLECGRLGVSEREIGKMYKIYNNEDAKGLAYIVFQTINGKTERAKHLGKKGEFRTLKEAQEAVYNQEKYGTQKI